MPRTLKDLSAEERTALLNTNLDDLVIPDNVFDSLKKPGSASGAASWGIVNGSGCGKSALDNIGDLKQIADKIIGR